MCAHVSRALPAARAVFACLALLALAPHAACEELNPPTSAFCSDPNSGLLLVSLLDGSINAYRSETGAYLWSVSLAHAMSSSWNKEGWPQVIADIDGRIYQYNAAAPVIGAESKLPPVILSFKESKALYIDRCSGKVLRSFAYRTAVEPNVSPGERLSASSTAGSGGGGAGVGEPLADDVRDWGSDVLVLRYIESGVRVFDPWSAEMVANCSVIHTHPSIFHEGGQLGATAGGTAAAADAVHVRERVRIELPAKRDEMVAHSLDGHVLWRRKMPSLVAEAHGLNRVDVHIQAPVAAVDSAPTTLSSSTALSESKHRTIIHADSDGKSLLDDGRRAESGADLPGTNWRGAHFLPEGEGEGAHRGRRGLRSADARSWRELSMAALFGALVISAPAAVMVVMSSRGDRPVRQRWRRLRGGVHDGADADGRAAAATPRKSQGAPATAGAQNGASERTEDDAGGAPTEGVRNRRNKKRKKRKGGAGATEASTTPAKAQEDEDTAAAAPAAAAPQSGVNGTPAANGGTAPAAGRSPEGWLVVGRMRVSSKVLGMGSHGTVVFEGLLQPGDRPVAVKRLLRYLYDAARKEISLLISLDESTPNLVRYFAMEEDSQFIYLALELCAGSLVERVDSRQPPALTDADLQHARTPPHAVLALRELVLGLQNLHRAGVVHRDLKPQNVLLSRGDWRKNEVQVKIGDVGLAIRLDADRSSYSHLAGNDGVGSVGWRAPEVLLNSRQTKAVDVFSIGCIFYYLLSGGGHPFGAQSYQRDARILSNEVDLSALANDSQQGEARHLIAMMLQRDADKRPSAEQLLLHPFFWSDARKLNFVVDVADKLHDPRWRLAERIAAQSGAAAFEDWQLHVNMALLKELARTTKMQRSYESSVVGLLRVIRNKRSHYGELSEELQRLLGALPVDASPPCEHNYFRYFAERFPTLLMFTYRFAKGAREFGCDPHFASYCLQLEPSNATAESAAEALQDSSLLLTMAAVSDVHKAKEELVQHSVDALLRGALVDDPREPDTATVKALTLMRIYDRQAAGRWRERAKRYLLEGDDATPSHPPGYG